jgi:hypothetical protein
MAETAEQKELLQKVNQAPLQLHFHHVKAHRDNWKNNAVDRLCNININPVDRINKEHLTGSKTPSAIKEWVDTFLSYERRHRAINSRIPNSRTQDWIKRISDRSVEKIKRPKFYNMLPRREGILLAKARTYRWNNCQWFLHFIKQSPSPNCETCSTRQHQPEDTIGHVLNECEKHDALRNKLILRTHHQGEISDLLTSTNKTEVEELVAFLIGVEDMRIKEAEEKEKERSLANTLPQPNPTTLAT